MTRQVERQDDAPRISLPQCGDGELPHAAIERQSVEQDERRSVVGGPHEITAEPCRSERPELAGRSGLGSGGLRSRGPWPTEGERTWSDALGALLAGLGSRRDAHQ